MFAQKTSDGPLERTGEFRLRTIPIFDGKDDFAPGAHHARTGDLIGTSAF
jgi:hypothetical protein